MFFATPRDKHGFCGPSKATPRDLPDSVAPFQYDRLYVYGWIPLPQCTSCCRTFLRQAWLQFVARPKILFLSARDYMTG